MSVREQLLESIKDKLKLIPGVNPDNVIRGQALPEDEDQMPFITLKPLQQKRNETLLTALDNLLSVEVSLWVSGFNPDSLADDLIAGIDNAFFEDRSFDGLALHTEPGTIEFEFDHGNLPQVQVNLEFSITYREIINY